MIDALVSRRKLLAKPTRYRDVGAPADAAFAGIG
jgi:hypothetical protein